MRLKFLVATIICISFLSFDLPAANAGALQLSEPIVTWGDGSYFAPIVNLHMWAGDTIQDKYSSGRKDRNTGEPVKYDNSTVGYAGSVNAGFDLKKGKLSAEMLIPTCYYFADSDGMLDDTYSFSAPNIGVQYAFTPDIIFWTGKNYDLGISNTLGDAIPLATPGDNGFRSYTTALPGGMGIGVNAYGAFFGIFNQGYSKAINGLTPNGESDAKYSIPRFIVSYSTKPPYAIGASFQYQTKTLKYSPPLNPTATDNTEYLANLDGKKLVAYSAGAQADIMNLQTGIMFHVHGYYHQNMSDLQGTIGQNAESDGSAGMDSNGNGIYTDPGDMAPVDATKIYNTTGYGGNIAVAYTIGGKIEPAIGYAYKIDKNDNWAFDNPEQAYFFRVKYIIEPMRFNFQPGIIVVDKMKGSGRENPMNPLSARTKEGKEIKFGLYIEAMM